MQYSAVCVLLARPLPAGFGTPDSLLPFLSRLLDAAIESPSATTVRPLYNLLSPRQSTLLEVLPTETMRAFQARFLGVLKHTDSQSVNLLCLGVFARLVSGRRPRHPSVLERAGSVESLSDGSHPQQHPAAVESIDQFFNGSKAGKTIQLVVLRVILACSESNQAAISDALETVSLATEILDTVEAPIRSRWVESSHATLQKLYEKMRRTGLPTELQFRV